MRILLVGNGNSFLIQGLAKALKDNDSTYVVDILSDRPLLKGQLPYSNTFDIHAHYLWRKIPIIRVLHTTALLNKQLKKIDTNHYDTVHILYVAGYYKGCVKQFKRIGKKLVSTIFGSDFYKSGNILRWMMTNVVQYSDIITSSNAKTLKESLSYFKVDESNGRLNYFGLNILDEIDNLTEEDINSFRNFYNIPVDQKLMALGYNASVNQNLFKIAQQVVSVKEDLKDYALTMQLYGNRSDEVKKTIELLQSNGYTLYLFDERWSDKVLAAYRKTVDVMIQVQTTDVFSGAMQEHLYGGAKVITGKWLPYDMLNSKGIDYILVDDFSEIGKKLIENKDKQVDVKLNQSIIASYSKWKITIEKWKALYA